MTLFQLASLVFTCVGLGYAWGKNSATKQLRAARLETELTRAWREAWAALREEGTK